MTDTERPIDPPEAEPAVPDRHGPLGAIAGADGAALGIDPATQRLDPPQADVDPTDAPVPRREELPRTAERPWHTTLAGTGPDTGVQSDVDAPDDDKRGRTTSA